MILHGGTYTQTCRRATTVNGTPANPITIRAADGESPLVTRPEPANFSYNQNNLEIVNSSYLVVKGLRFKGGDVRHNVIHDTTSGRQYPCIFVYGGGAGLNVVEGNAMWNCGEAIQVVSDAIVRNNLILSSGTGITAAPHAQVAQMRNVTIASNTIHGHSTCLVIRWSGASSMVLANNALYCPGATAVNGSGLTGRGLTITTNYVEGSLSGAALDGSRFVAGGTSAAAFTDPAQLDFWPPPGSILIGKADAGFAAALDFNEKARVAPFDVGAYETDGLATNPGWKVAPGLKPTGPGGSLPVAPTNLRLQ